MQSFLADEVGIPQPTIDALVHGGCCMLDDLQYIDSELLDALHITKPMERKKLLVMVQSQRANHAAASSSHLLSIAALLERHQIVPEQASKYALQLSAQGFDSVDKLAHVTADDLAFCGITARFDSRVILGIYSGAALPMAQARRRSSASAAPPVGVQQPKQQQQEEEKAAAAAAVGVVAAAKLAKEEAERLRWAELERQQMEIFEREEEAAEAERAAAVAAAPPAVNQEEDRSGAAYEPDLASPRHFTDQVKSRMVFDSDSDEDEEAES